MDKKNQEMIDHFMEAVMTLRTQEECYKFFGDVCSSDELNKIARRVRIAKMIVDGRTYREILEETNTSNPTVSRIKGVMDKEESILEDVVKRI